MWNLWPSVGLVISFDGALWLAGKGVIIKATTVIIWSYIIYDGSSRGPLPEKKKKIHKGMIGIKPCNHLKQKLVTWLTKKVNIWFFLFFFFLCFAHLDNPNVRTRQSKLYKFFRGRGSWLRRTGRGCNYVTNEFFLVFFFSEFIILNSKTDFIDFKCALCQQLFRKSKLCIWRSLS